MSPHGEVESTPNTSSRVVEASRSSPEAIRRLLETRGFLARLLQPSHDDMQAYISMEDTELAQLFSALAEKCNRRGESDRSRAPPGCVLPVLRFLECVTEGRRIERDVHVFGGCSAASNEGRIRRKRNRVESESGGWATCLAFMIAYDALSDVGALEPVATPEGGGGGENESARNCEGDAIVTKALRIIGLTRRSKTCHAKVSRDLLLDRQTSVEKCFSLELQRIDALVASRKRAHKRKRDIDVIDSQRGNIESVWSGIDLGGDDDDDSSDDAAISVTDTAKECDNTVAITKAQDVEVQVPVQHRQGKGADELVGTNEAVTDGPEVSVSPLDQASIDLRSTLLNSVPGATQSELDLMAERIVELIQRGGTECGAEGVARIGTILIRGIDGCNTDQTSSGALTQDNTAEVAGSPLTDELIASASKKYINQGTSAIRSSVYIRSFVLPLVANLDGSKPASRTLVSLMSWLARERPSEMFSSLLTPALCAPVDIGKLEAGAQCSDKTGPSKSLCDLSSRMAKATKDKESIADLLAGLILGETPEIYNIPDGSCSKEGMVWTDESIPIITACINKRAPLPDETVTEMSHRIQHSATNMSKSMKFSTCFHAFVTKYGSQLKKLSLVKELSLSAEKLQTFMGKTITSVLKKL